MKASDLFLKCLESLGVDTIFGVPGEENADIMISLLKSNIEFIVCRHEQSAAFMAGMYGHLTGKPGVCLATLGPGATNLLTGVANTNMDNAPIIALIGQADTTRLHKESHQNMDSVSMYQPVTKWAVTVREPENIPEIVLKGYKIATTAKPGAVAIELPEDIAKLETDVKPLEGSCFHENSYPAKEEVAKAIELIRAAKKPILLLGAGCVRERCDEEINQFVEHTGIYYASTFMGKGAASTRNEQSLFCVGLGMKDIAVQAFDEADLVIAAGYDMVEWAPSRWNPKGDKKIIHIDTIPAEVDASYIPAVELIGNVKLSFQLLAEQLDTQCCKEPDTFADYRKRIFEEITEHNQDDSYPMKPQRILSDVREVMRDDDILISDTGAHKMWVARQYTAYKPGSVFISNGFCSMAHAVPGAVAAKRLHPEKNVVALCGDGGFMMGIQALPTAVRYKIPMVVLVWEDSYYGLIKWKQEMAYHEFSHVELDNPDLVEVSKAFGCHSVRVNAADELKSALTEAFKSKDKPTVIVVPVDYTENMKLTKHLGEIVSH